jgi:hypothetical protein
MHNHSGGPVATRRDLQGSVKKGGKNGFVLLKNFAGKIF